MEKKVNAMAARALLAPISMLPVVDAHWLARKQKPTNHRKLQSAAGNGQLTRASAKVTGVKHGSDFSQSECFVLHRHYPH
ncbi:hypothetical protein FKM82_029533 [Ascaphus truei]